MTQRCAEVSARTMSSGLPTGAVIEKSWTTVNRAWQVEVAVVIGVWLLLPQLLSPFTGQFESSGLFIILFLGVGLLDLGMAWWMKSRPFAQIAQADASSVENQIGLLLLRPRLEEWQEIVGRKRIDANRRS